MDQDFIQVSAAWINITESESEVLFSRGQTLLNKISLEKINKPMSLYVQCSKYHLLCYSFYTYIHFANSIKGTNNSGGHCICMKYAILLQWLLIYVWDFALMYCMFTQCLRHEHATLEWWVMDVCLNEVSSLLCAAWNCKVLRGGRWT